MLGLLLEPSDALVVFPVYLGKVGSGHSPQLGAPRASVNILDIASSGLCLSGYAGGTPPCEVI